MIAVTAVDRAAIVRSADTVADLATGDRVAQVWDRPSVLPGMTIGGLAWHLVSQFECAVEFLGLEPPADIPLVTRQDYFPRIDWLDAGVDAPENTSIRDDFNEMAGAGPAAAQQIMRDARAALPDAIAAAGPTTYVPWQACSLPTDDFLAVRLLEIVVHTDDLAQSLAVPTPEFDDGTMSPVLALLSELAVRRHGQQAVVRALARTERAPASVSAF